MQLVWPDILIAAVLLVAALKGFKRGFVSELSGAVALICAFITPWFYNGAFDGVLEQTLHTSAGSSHVIGLFLTGIATYTVVMLAARVLNLVAKLPVLGTGNALLGAAVGLLKGAVLVWLVLYVALFFPLSPQIRADLHRSRLAAALTLPDARIDRAVIATLPSFARPFVRPYFAHHRV